MKKLIVTMLIGVVLAGGVAVYAGDSCCGGKGAHKAGMSDVLGKLKLTDEQKAKVATLQQDCKATECTGASRAKFMKGLESILTVDQLAQFKQECAKGGKGECPMSAAPKADK